MKQNTNLIVTAVALVALATTSLMNAGTTAPVISDAPSTAVLSTVKGYGAVLIPDEGEDLYGGGISLEVPVFGRTLFGELGFSVFEDDVQKLDANLIVNLPLTEQIAAYGLAGLHYHFDESDWQDSFGFNFGAGVRYNIAAVPTLSLFSDVVYSVSESEKHDGDVTVRLGLGFGF